ncbi:MAG TPA: GNAT family N-acetyltransferase [Candidatus Merdivicinus intestinigallinarum]|nr:GNAT family N-acetyltransferase [Candidatus Merdivicinus intestinigallinarum]
MIVRPAKLEDSVTIGKIYCDSWKAAYKGIMPQDHLDALTPDDRTINPANYLVLESEEGVVFGLANLGSSRDKERPDWGELRAIYLLPEYWRKGSGTALFQGAEAELGRRGYSRYFLWVLTENVRARRFYEKMGMRLSGREQSFTLGGKELWECRYEKELL